MSVQKTRLLALAYFLVAVSIRFLPHGVNFGAVGALALFAGCRLSLVQGALMGLGAMAVSDSIGHWLDLGVIGYYDRATMLAVYGCMALPSLLGWMIKGRASVITVPSMAVASSVLFYLITNFACWLDPMMGYARTLEGLVSCYVSALPWAGNDFLGTLFFSCSFFGIHALAVRHQLAVPAQSE